MRVAESNIAQSPLPAGASEKYPGKWIAVRAGEVVASADELEDLRADERIEPDDALYHVPPQGAYFF